MKKWIKKALLGAFIIAVIAIGIVSFIQERKSVNDDTSQMFVTTYLEAFNAQFMSSLGSNIDGNRIKYLFSLMERFKKFDEYNISINGITDISKIDSEATYNVVESYTTEGYIYKLTITKNNSDAEQPEKIELIIVTIFNEQFNSYLGLDVDGASLNNLLRYNYNMDDKINIDGVTDISNIATYSVTESYDENGMINKITLKRNNNKILIVTIIVVLFAVGIIFYKKKGGMKKEETEKDIKMENNEDTSTKNEEE